MKKVSFGSVYEKFYIIGEKGICEEEIQYPIDEEALILDFEKDFFTDPLLTDEMTENSCSHFKKSKKIFNNHIPCKNNYNFKSRKKSILKKSLMVYINTNLT